MVSRKKERDGTADAGASFVMTSSFLASKVRTVWRAMTGAGDTPSESETQKAATGTKRRRSKRTVGGEISSPAKKRSRTRTLGRRRSRKILKSSKVSGDVRSNMSFTA